MADPAAAAAIPGDTAVVQIESRLWELAYTQLKVSSPKLVQAYEDKLAEFNETEGSNGETVTFIDESAIGDIVKKALEAYEKKKVLIQIRGHSISIRAQLEKVFKFTLWANSFISSALSTQPYGALAWAGVSILLPLFLNSTKQKEKMVNGLDRLADILVLYQIREKVYLTDGQQSVAQSGLVQAVVDVYSKVLDYQINLIAHLSQRGLKRGLKDTFESIDWPAKVKALNEADVKCTAIITTVRHASEQLYFDNMMHQISNMLAGQETLQKELIFALESSQTQRQQERLDDKKEELMRLLASPYRSDKDFNPKRVPLTCEWVFNDPAFQRWQESTDSSLLWLSAGPGCGKSVLSRCLIDENRLTPRVTTATVCYFFFKDGQARRQEAENAIAAILHQVFKQQAGTALMNHAIPNNDGESLLNNFSQLWDLLVRCASDSKAGEIVCLIDALDECQKDSRERLLSQLVNFFSARGEAQWKQCHIKFLVTSRPYENVHTRLGTLEGRIGFVHFDADEKSLEVANDIDRVIEHELPQILPYFNEFSNADREGLLQRLKGHKNRTYLWLYLTFGLIKDQPSSYSKASTAKDLLENLPTDLYKAYEQILQKSPHHEVARCLLKIIIAARIPLTLEQVNYALTVATSKRESGSLPERLDFWPIDGFKRLVKDMCGLFVRVEDGKVFLIHQTAREFLIGTHKSHSDHIKRPFHNSVDPAEGDALLSLACLTCLEGIASKLDFDDDGSFMRHIKDWEYSIPDNQPSTPLEVSPHFNRYTFNNWLDHTKTQTAHSRMEMKRATRSWLEHAMDHAIVFGNTLGHDADELFWNDMNNTERRNDINNTERRKDIWEGRLSERRLRRKLHQTREAFWLSDEKIRELETMSEARRALRYLNPSPLLHLLLDKFSYMLPRLLLLAIALGLDEVAQDILPGLTYIPDQSDILLTVLNFAAHQGLPKTVDSLLCLGVNADSLCPMTNVSPIQRAVLSGQPEVVQLLLNWNVKVNFINSSSYAGVSETALLAAVRTRKPQLVEMLLEYGADATVWISKSPLAAAIHLPEPHWHIARLILRHSNLKIDERTYADALEAAIGLRSGDFAEEVDRLYSQFDNSRINFDRCLRKAIRSNATKWLSILVKRGADPFAKDDPLDLLLDVLSGDQVAMLQWLLQFQPNLSTEDMLHLLMHSISCDSRGCTSLLLQTFPELRAERQLVSALYLAPYAEESRWRNRVVKEIYDIYRESAESDTNIYAFSLSTALENGAAAVVNLLALRGVGLDALPSTVNVRCVLDNTTWRALEVTPLCAASLLGCERLIQRLLDRGANVNERSGDKSENYFSGTALSAATYKGHVETVKLLLDNEARPEVPGYGSWPAAYRIASSRGHVEIRQLLAARIKKLSKEPGCPTITEMMGGIRMAHDEQWPVTRTLASRPKPN